MAKKNSNNVVWLPSSSESQKFDMLYPMIKSDLAEIRELSKKKQDEPLNSFKVKMLNKKLGQVKELLREEPSIQYLELLDEETLPTNSDAVLMVSQFINAMTQFRDKYYTSDGSDWDFFGPRNTWKTSD